MAKTKWKTGDKVRVNDNAFRDTWGRHLRILRGKIGTVHQVGNGYNYIRFDTGQGIPRNLNTENVWGGTQDPTVGIWIHTRSLGPARQAVTLREAWTM